jgi:hypothetical protein
VRQSAQKSRAASVCLAGVRDCPRLPVEEPASELPPEQSEECCPIALFGTETTPL